MATSINAAGPVDNSSSARGVLKTTPYAAVQIRGGFWASRRSVNAQVSLKHGYAMLARAGNFQNLFLAAQRGDASGYRGHNFADESIYKWLEALAWQLGSQPDDQLQQMADEIITSVMAAQEPDGYLDSYYQVVEPDHKWTDLDFGHELYCAGHLFQAAIAFHRALADDRLLAVARRLADHIGAVFGPGKKEGTCGHPEIEMALVELHRATGEQAYLDLAQFFIDQRGQRKMKGMGSYGPEYHQDHVPVRQAAAAAGHAVRQMYLNTGVADVYMETAEPALWEATQRLWQDIVGSKMHLTGGVGSRYDGEAFGESFELPPDQCYCETCAAIGSFMWNWRLLLLSGEGRYADLMERTLYNAILCSPAFDGRHFAYVNPLMLRTVRSLRESANRPNDANPAERATSTGRPEWHSVACCPPNVMRLLASLTHYLATTDASGIQIHQYMSADLQVTLGSGQPVALRLVTNYPWQGDIQLSVQVSPTTPWQLRLRIPGWCQAAAIAINGQIIPALDIQAGYAVLDRTWQAGDEVRLELSMPPVLIQPNPRVDALRGCLAIQRGPLVYCLEGTEQADGVNLLDVSLDPDAPLEARWLDDLLGGLVVIEASGHMPSCGSWTDQLYRPQSGGLEPAANKVRLLAIPYFAWGNRGLASMRIWIPSGN